MKQAIIISASLFGICLVANAQKESGPRLYDKERIDSLFNQQPRLLQPFAVTNPGSVKIGTTSKGTVYSMPKDNMAVLVPDMNNVERMPGSGNYTIAPPAIMPNPMYPDKAHQKRKRIE